MKVMMYYIAIGIFVMFLIEHSTERYKNEMEYYGEEVPQFNWFDRIANILLWPITIMLFIKNVKDLFK